MRQPACVGALIRDDQQRVYAQRRTPDRPLLPGIWDILMMEGRTDGDRRLRDIVAKAVRTRLTGRLRLEPIGLEHAEDLWRLHRDDAVAAWHGGVWTVEAARRNAAGMAEAWETAGVGKWIAYVREFAGRGLVEGRDGIHDGAPFALYAVGRQGG
jgi:hypothetical protein